MRISLDEGEREATPIRIASENKQGGSLADLEEEIAGREFERKIRKAEAVIKLGDAMRRCYTARQEGETE